jgi:tetratricopeptide (TPR) repeat protein
MRFAAFLFAVMLPATVWAAPPRPLDALFAQLHAAPSPEDAKPIEEQIRALFRQSGSPSVDLLMARAAAAEAAGDKDTARQLVDAVTNIASNYAEGWHQRGLLQNKAGDDTGAMMSLQKAIALNPRQFEALEQLGEMLEDYGDKAGALKMYRRAQALNPQFEGLQRHIDGLSRAVEGQGI